MSRYLAILFLIASCSMDAVLTSTSATSSTTMPTAVAPTTTTSPVPPSAGHLVRLDLATLEHLAGLEPISINDVGWTVASDDGSLVATFGWDEASQVTHARTVDVEQWKEVSSFDLGPISAITIHGDQLYAHNDQSGELSGTDLITGDRSVLADWSANHWLWEAPVAISKSQIGVLVTGPPRQANLVFTFDTETKSSAEHPIEPIERVGQATGIFDGDYEILEIDQPGIAWGDNSLFIAYMDGPEVVEVDLETGDIKSHTIELSSWWDRVLAAWMPAASAKGPSLGTFSSAALSPDGRYLFMSGNRETVTEAPVGTLAGESEHLGLIVVDTETWHSIPGSDLPIQRVTALSGLVMGVNTTSFNPWTSDYYLLTLDHSGKPIARGPVTVTDGICEPAADGQHLICTGYGSPPMVRVIDMETLETVAERSIGHEDALLPNGVLVDSLPRSDP